MYRFSCGDLLMRDQTRTVSVFVIHSADFLQQVKSSEDFRVPFTYMTNCRLNDPVFERGLRDFMAVCNVVKKPSAT